MHRSRRRPRLTLSLAGAVLVALLLASMLSGDRLGVAGFTDPGSPSAKAQVTMRRALGFDPFPGMVVLASAQRPVTAPATQAALKLLAARLRTDQAVGHVDGPIGPQPLPELISHDGRTALLLVHFKSTDADSVTAPISRLRERVREPGLALRFGGYAVGALDLNQIARSDLVRAELLAFPLLAVIMLLIFRGLTASSIPLLIGASSVVGTFALLRLLSNVINLSIFALNLAVLLGLGLAVDYGLFLVSRYREEVGRSGYGAQAVSATLAGAGRAVVFSGLAVGAACAVLLVFPQEFIYSMGIAGLLVALLSAGAALLLVPPLLLLAGPRISAQPRRAAGWWAAFPRAVMRHHKEVALLGVLIFVAAAAPALRLRTTFPDRDAIPIGVQSRTVGDTIDRQFTPNLFAPIVVAARLPAGSPRSSATARFEPALVQAVLSHQVLLGPLQVLPDGLAILSLVPSGSPVSSATTGLVKHLRQRRFALLVSGPSAEFVDLQRSIVAHLPLTLGLVALTTMVALLLLTSSIVLPLKALVFHALGLLSTFGLLVLIFQHNLLSSSALVAYRGPPAIEITVSVVIAVSAFGLATDYSILLLSRIVERHRLGDSDQDAVAHGISLTGPVITSSALLLAVALLALTTSRIFLVKQLTVGQVLGVLIDVTLVRMLLLPALMRLLGPLNWWAPRRLRRLLDGRSRRQRTPEDAPVDYVSSA